MSELTIPPLLARLPELQPPRRWWAYLLPALIAVTGILLANITARAGARAANAFEHARIAENVATQRAILETDRRQALELRDDLFQRRQFNPADSQTNLLQQISKLDDQIAIAQANVATAAAEKVRSEVLPGNQFTNWDARRYEEIATKGYFYDMDAVRRGDIVLTNPDGTKQLINVVWYPLYPLLGRAAWTLTGHRLTMHSSLTLVSDVCIILGAMVVFAFARRHFYNRIALDLSDDHPARRYDLQPADTAALWTLTLVLFNPCAIFFYSNYSESLFLLLLGLFLLAIQGRRWWVAAAVAALASATRSQGVLFGPFLAITFFLRSDLPTPLRAGKAAVLAVVSALGLAVYMIYLHQNFGDPLAFMHAQVGWNVAFDWAHITYGLNPTHALTNAMYWTWHEPLVMPRFYEAWCVIVPPIVILLLGARFLSFELELIAWGLWILPYVTNSMAGNPPFEHAWISMGRFMLANLPLGVIIGAMVVRFRWAGPLLVATSAAVFAYFAYLSGTGDWIG
jgi:Gpi18-like mannosyltransferase